MAAPNVHQAFRLAFAHHQAGRLAEAEAIYGQILAVEPGHAEALHLLGVIAGQTGRSEAAIALITKAIALKPDCAEAHGNLGNALCAAGQLDAAIAAFRRAIALKHNLPEVHASLGTALKDTGQLDEAIAAYRQAIALRPNSPEAHSNLGNALRDCGKLDEAIAALRTAIALGPGLPEVHSNLGNALRDNGQLDEAIAAYRRSIALKPTYAKARYNLASAMYDKGQLDQAITHFQEAIALDPGFPGAHGNLGNALLVSGRLHEAIASYRQAIALKPDYREAHGNLVFALNYHPEFDAQSIADEHRRWGKRHAEPLREFIQPHHNDRNPERCLRIGYVSRDFRAHSVAFFIEPLLAFHDPAQVDVFCYASVIRPDPVTARLRGLVPHWRDIARVSDEEAAGIIRDDGIDILVDLSGHTSHNRLPIFARKPAPVQVSWLGYPNTTGMTAMDCRLTDAHADPPGSTEPLHTEELVRLPDCAWCFRPPEDAPPVCLPPAAHAGFITFGCFNSLPKINGPLLELWSQILRAVPGSRLLLKNASLPNASVQERLKSAFGDFGISPERIEMAGFAPSMAGHLAAYHRVDIALDTFPYHGTTTTCEALWMGVPVITLAGNTHASRVGVSLLSNVGLGELIAHSGSDYVGTATSLAADLPRLAQLRATLRARMQTSVLTDAPRFARNIEAAFRQMWRNHLHQFLRPIL